MENSLTIDRRSGERNMMNAINKRVLMVILIMGVGVPLLCLLIISVTTASAQPAIPEAVIEGQSTAVVVWLLGALLSALSGSFGLVWYFLNRTLVHSDKINTAQWEKINNCDTRINNCSTRLTALEAEHSVLTGKGNGCDNK